MAQPKIAIENLSKQFYTRGGGVVDALTDVSLTVPEGTFLVIVGPSGCGKTTLLRILAGLEEKTSGRLLLNQTNPNLPLNSMVFQEQSVLPWMTVKHNIAYGLQLRGVDRKTRNEIAMHYCNMVGLNKFVDAYPHQLSGGMKQRVSIARAFANDPEILLMDEPFAALDEQNKVLLQQELLRIWEANRKTVVYITHSIDEAVNLGDRVLVMTARPGRIKDIIDVGIPRPRDVAGIRSNPAFNDLFYRIWSALKDEVLRAKAAEGLQVARA